MLQRHLGAFDLTLVGRATELPHEFGALGEPGRAQRVALREQAARRVRDILAAVGVVAVEMNFSASPSCRGRAPRR